MTPTPGRSKAASPASGGSERVSERGGAMSAHGRSKALIPERAARRVVQ